MELLSRLFWTDHDQFYRANANGSAIFALAKETTGDLEQQWVSKYAFDKRRDCG